MATLTYYQYPYAAYQEGSIYSPGTNEPQYDSEDFLSSAIDPALHDSMSGYSLFPQDMSRHPQGSLQLYPSPSYPMHLPSSSPSHQNADLDRHTSSFHYSASQEPLYSPPAQVLRSNSVANTGGFAWSSEMTHTTPTFGTSQAGTFQFSPLPSSPQVAQQNPWGTESAFMSSAAPDSEIQPRPQLIAMRELEYESPGNDSNQPCVDDQATSTQVNFSAQPTPEDLDLSESIGGFAPPYHNNILHPHVLDISEEGVLSTDHSPRSESDYATLYAHRPQASPPVRNMMVPTHGRTNSTTSTRSARGCLPNHSVLDSHSRIHKGRPFKGASPPQTNAKDKSRPKSSNPKLSAIERSQMDKHAKFFPCAFHLFGCPATFGNKNEWKRHIYSQHLQLYFYRCDMGDCNPEYNPKLYVAADKSRSGRFKCENSDLLDDEEKDIIFNDFNRKDLFTQHCRRMHGPTRHATDNTTLTNQMINARLNQRHQAPSGSAGGNKAKVKIVVTKEDEAAFERELDDIRARCRTLRRKAPTKTSCGFCGEVFLAELGHATSSISRSLHEDGRAEERAWEDRMEHMGRHFERDGYPACREAVDEDLVDWGLSVGILENVVDHEGVQKPWLVGSELRGSPIHGEDGDEDGIKITGIRHQSEQKRAGLRCKKESLPFRRHRAMSSDSDEDASAEDD